MDQLTSVLVVEDLLDLRAAIQEVIDRQPDFEVVGTAGNGEEGLALYRELKPDILMTNVMMPIMDGFTLTTKILAIDPAAKVVICSAKGTLEDIQHGLELGAAWYLVKPFSEKQLLDTLRAVIRGGPPGSNL